MFFKKWIEETPHRLENNEIMRVKDWLAILLVTIMPGLNIVMLLCWAFNRDDSLPKSHVNFARAVLIIMVITVFASVAVYFLYLWMMAQTGE